jgi:hypothetical protein
MRSLVVRRSGRSIRWPTHRDCKQHVASGRSCSCGALLGRAGDQRRRLPVPHRPRYLYRPSLAGRVHRGEARGRNCCRQTAERHHRRKNRRQADLRWRHGRCAAGHAKARRSRPSPRHSSRALTPGERHRQQISSTSAARRYAFEKIDGSSRMDRTIRSTNGRRRWQRMALATRGRLSTDTCHNVLGAAGIRGNRPPLHARSPYTCGRTPLRLIFHAGGASVRRATMCRCLGSVGANAPRARSPLSYEDPTTTRPGRTRS